jgi:hypothetical protein
VQAIAQMTQQMLAFQREAPMVQAHPIGSGYGLCPCTLEYYEF